MLKKAKHKQKSPKARHFEWMHQRRTARGYNIHYYISKPAFRQAVLCLKALGITPKTPRQNSRTATVQTQKSAWQKASYQSYLAPHRDQVKYAQNL